MYVHPDKLLLSGNYLSQNLKNKVKSEHYTNKEDTFINYIYK